METSDNKSVQIPKKIYLHIETEPDSADISNIIFSEKKTAESDIEYIINSDYVKFTMINANIINDIYDTASFIGKLFNYDIDKYIEKKSKQFANKNRI